MSKTEYISGLFNEDNDKAFNSLVNDALYSDWEEYT